MLFLYSVLLAVGICLLLPLFALDALRHGKYVAGLRERLGDVPPLRAAPVIWLHCVSVGETQAAQPLVRALRAQFPAHTLVVSTTTLTGQRLARELFHADTAHVFYFPFDWAWSVRRALDRVNPAVVLILETELWPRFLYECKRRGTPVVLVNGRISEKSFRGYKKFGPLIRRVVNSLTLALMQTDADAARIAALGLDQARVHVSGNIKFDAPVDTDASGLTDQLRARFALQPAQALLLAASTHAPEEAIVIEAFKRTRAAVPDQTLRLLIAPRHPERFAEVAALLAASGLTWARRSTPAQASDATCDAILLDSIGELRHTYPLAVLVFVGGSIARTGGHNVLEPAAAAKCIITGAHTFNFKAIMRDLQAQDAIIQLPALPDAAAPAALAHTLQELLQDAQRRHATGTRARQVLEQNRGATARTMKLLTPLLQVNAK